MTGFILDVPIWTMFNGIIPFVVIEACFVALLIAFPQNALFLPGLAG
ncbi:MAG TPA: hypothetical protein G4O09_07520 [Dehalococcoidia bacterium]|nr:hypothetical protein [Dehalococcoidia bacterium]